MMFSKSKENYFQQFLSAEVLTKKDSLLPRYASGQAVSFAEPEEMKIYNESAILEYKGEIHYLQEGDLIEDIEIQEIYQDSVNVEFNNFKIMIK